MALTRQTVTIGYTDGRTVTYPITPKIQLIFERVHKLSITKLSEGSAATNVYTLAHFVQSQNLEGYPTIFPLSIEDWLDSVDAVMVDEEAVVPFGGAQLNGGSAPLPLRPESAIAN